MPNIKTQNLIFIQDNYNFGLAQSGFFNVIADMYSTAG